MSEREHQSCSNPTKRPRPLRLLIVVLVPVALAGTGVLLLLAPLKGRDSDAYLARLKVGMPEKDAYAILGNSWRFTGENGGSTRMTVIYEDMRLLRASHDHLMLEIEFESLAGAHGHVMRATLLKGGPDTRSLLKRLVDWVRWKVRW
jgi:hypothetical protein